MDAVRSQRRGPGAASSARERAACTVKAWTLGSGSKGNAIVLESDGTRVLIDVGYSPRALAQRLASVHIAPESISAVILTHEHIDHMRGVCAAQRRWKWQVYGSAGTIAAIAKLNPERCTPVRSSAAFTIGAMQIELVRVPHDAAATTAVVATATRTGFRTGVAHDLGAVRDSLRRAFARLDLLLLESNHDDEMLANGPYPPFLQSRISGGSGHLSNRKSAAFAQELAGPALRELVLLHLSEVNNTPRHALEAAKGALKGARVQCPVTAAPQDRAAGPFGETGRGGARHRVAAQQLQLAL
jgi:phosphoribosyl 1,2-cyclic phosphodiesterase